MFRSFGKCPSIILSPSLSVILSVAKNLDPHFVQGDKINTLHIITCERVDINIIVLCRYSCNHVPTELELAGLLAIWLGGNCFRHRASR